MDPVESMGNGTAVSGGRGPSADEMAEFVAELKRAAESQSYVPREAGRESIDAETGCVTHVMGLRSENVQLLEKQYGTKIKIIHGVEARLGRTPRESMSRIIVDGPDVMKVQETILDIEARLYHVRSPQQVPVGRAFIGKVIGRSGERLKEIQEVSGTELAIDQRLDPCLIEIKGNPSSLLAAIDLIQACIEGRYASTLNRYGPSNLDRAALVDPYKELDKNWLPARDPEGRVYWYNTLSGKTQWNYPFAPS